MRIAVVITVVAVIGVVVFLYLKYIKANPTANVIGNKVLEVKNAQYTSWLKQQPPAFQESVKQATLKATTAKGRLGGF